MQQKQEYFAYLLLCSDNSLYAGWTTDIDRRVNTHNSGKGARYTRSRIPVKLIASWKFESKSEAMKMEYEIKQMSRQEKLRLVSMSGL